MDTLYPSLFGSFITVFIFIVFIMVFGGFIYVIAKNIKTCSYNNAQPVLTVWAKVVSRRTDVTYHNHNNINNNMNNFSSTTWYYVTFQVESKDRMEFAVDGYEFGMLSEGDTGKLTFQGSRFKGFERDI